MSDYENDPEYQQWAANVRRNLIPKLQASFASVSIVPEGQPDVKFSVELGLSVMLDKPIIAVVPPGTKLPAKLVAVADEIVEANIAGGDQDKLQQRLGSAIDRIYQRQQTGGAGQ